ncbi:hypothetical protein [Pontimonas sp.]|uniref:hypothetical protein n=1 Tax=Pontimonas sp. TaxID=2304492 RepID=UPI00286FE81D|nr:hypothetical protein [Pontimonas sp.]MDR9396619.1 hypothetical protein [Pontimonas sp.]
MDMFSIAGGLIIIGAFLWFVGKALSIWADTFSSNTSTPSTPPAPTKRQGGPDANGDHPDGMNEGDFHSGPGGYEPGTAYPETHYGEYGRDE